MQQRYITIFKLSIFGITISFSIGNPLWFINEFKKLKKGSD